ncbi:hypothetical protein [Pseudomonas sp.]|uniref:hypothetical protein n=1 Tax=Pseudomonas sp. TaxID=306 RepID=UPI003FD7104E
MSEVKRYHVTDSGLVEGQALGRISVVLASDYDAAVTHIRDLELLAGQEMKSTELATNAGLRVCLERDALQALLTAADERADVLEGLLLAAMPSKVCKCRECGGTSLTWYSHIKSNSAVAEGRLRTNEMSCVFFLGCDDCSETLAWVDADQIAAYLPISKP